MTHARIVKCQMLDWIKVRIANDEPSPTDDEIIDRFNFTGPQSARSLLADLCDEGAIRVGWHEPGRPITLGPKERAPLVPAMPSLALTRRAERDVDDAVKRIGNIVRRGSNIAEEVAAEAAETSGRRIHAGRSGQIRPMRQTKAPTSPPELATAPAPEPAPAPTLEMKRLATAPNRSYPRRRGTIATLDERKQINVHATADDHARLAAIADADGVSIGAAARTLLREALTARAASSPSDGKPRVRAAVVKAWQADGRPFGEFVTMLIDLGLSRHINRLPYENLEAAE